MVNARAIRQQGIQCQVQIPGVCDPDAVIEYHHRRLFARGGSHSAANIVAICDACHQWAHLPANRRWCIRAGLLLPSNPRRYWRRSEHVEVFGELRVTTVVHVDN